MAPPLTRTASGSRPPTKEIGAVLNGAFSMAGMQPWTHFVDTEETVPALIWPRSNRTYDEMRNDSQIAALYQATVLAIRKFEWRIDPNGADDKMVEKLSRDYNLPVLGQKENERKRGRAKHRFSFRDHLRKAMLAGVYGHYFFEQVGVIGNGKNGYEADGMWHLRKLAERPPKTIQDFRISDDGGLISIIQNIAPAMPLANTYLPEIPVDRLVGYVWDQEGANWNGRSWFRELHKNYLIKDRLMRIDAVNHERAGGVPYIEAHPGATLAEIQQLNEMAKSFRIGDTAGGAVPAGAKFQIARGTNSSVIDSIKYHDEAMARKFMLMVMQLGQTKTGSRALGTTFVDFWGGGLEAIAWWFADTFNEHVIEDDIDWNWGEEVDQVPILTFQFDPEMSVVDLVALITAGAIVVDDDLEHALRKELGLPDKGTPRPEPVAAPPQSGGATTASGGSNAVPAGGAATATKPAQKTVAAEVEGAPSRPELPPSKDTEQEEDDGEDS
jgi:hypothetical protein